MRDRDSIRTLVESSVEPADGDFQTMLGAPTATPACLPPRIDGVRIGKVVGFADGGATPLVTYPGQPAPAAQRARATLDLHGVHVGRDAVLMFEEADPWRPIVVGCLHQPSAAAVSGVAPAVDVEADGERLVVTAKHQMVLRCGRASVTLTSEGKVTIQGAYVSTQSSGVLRLKGGSVQIN